MGTSKFNAGGSPAMDQHPIQGGSRNTPSRVMLQKLATGSSMLGYWLLSRLRFSIKGASLGPLESLLLYVFLDYFISNNTVGDRAIGSFINCRSRTEECIYQQYPEQFQL